MSVEFVAFLLLGVVVAIVVGVAVYVLADRGVEQ